MTSGSRPTSRFVVMSVKESIANLYYGERESRKRKEGTVKTKEDGFRWRRRMTSWSTAWDHSGSHLRWEEYAWKERRRVSPEKKLTDGRAGQTQKTTWIPLNGNKMDKHVSEQTRQRGHSLSCPRTVVQVVTYGFRLYTEIWRVSENADDWGLFINNWLINFPKTMVPS